MFKKNVFHVFLISDKKNVFNFFILTSMFLRLRFFTIIDSLSLSRRRGSIFGRLYVLRLGLPDLPYFLGAPVFRPLSPVSRTEAKISRI